ncbi:response regulator [Sphingomonas sp.]|uniref:response regulator n=1 Tax=Sphingomonas sp. TaxID=28214 RepID=UPI003B3B289B
MADPLLLLVEDEPLIALSIQDCLEEAGHSVCYASSGIEAEQALEAGEPPIYALLTDIRCGPGADGWELSRKARERDPAIPVVYISGDSAGDHATHGVPDSVMIQKPFAPAKLIAAVESLLGARDNVCASRPAPAEVQIAAP